MKRRIVATNQFRKDYKQAMRRGLKIELLDEVIRLLANGNPCRKRTAITH